VLSGTGGMGRGSFGSGGPGPGISNELAGSLGRARGTRTAREFALSAGLSVSAFPVAFRINVCRDSLASVANKVL
jgi:hypothetical protein